MLSNFKIKQMLLILGASLFILVSSSVIVNYMQTNKIRGHVEEKEVEIMPHLLNFLTLKTDVIQVQQCLTDVSATRTKAGFDEAKKYFQDGNRVLDKLISDHLALNEPKMVNSIKEFRSNFLQFYKIGQKMANTYINQGTDAGNLMMEELDPFANKLTTSLDIWIDEHSKEAKTATMKIHDELAYTENAILILGILLIVIIITVLSIISKQIVESLNRFQIGLLDFFQYLNKEKTTVQLLDTSSKNEFGLMASIVNENIAKISRLIEEDAQLIEEVKDVVSKVNSGLLKQTLSKTTSNQSLEELKKLLNQMLEILSSKVCSDINKIQAALEHYQKLDFTYRIENCKGKTGQGLNALADIINKMLVENKTNGLTLEQSSDTLFSNVESLSNSSHQAAASLEETAAALEEITSNISNTTNNVIEMASHANDVTKSVNTGQILAKKTTSAMDEINVEVTAINDAISVIDQISFQTNILSLNAAVEAATAGEAGKGFAVVAQEVRNLASRSSEAANEIKTLVEHATNKANSGKSIADEMIHGYTSLNESISNTLNLIQDVENASKEQFAGIEQINGAIAELDIQTQQNASIANNTKDIALQTQTISKTIVNNANEKKFVGKDDIKI